MFSELFFDSVSTAQRKIEREENRLWAAVDPNCSLHDALKRLTKKELDIIRKNLNIKNISMLNKADLIDALSELIPSQYRGILYSLDQGRYDYLRILAEYSGIIPDMGISLDKIYGLMYKAIAFPGTYDGKKILYAPKEFIKAFNNTNGVELKNVIKRNTEWIQLTNGMLYYYGVMSMIPLYNMISKITKSDIIFSDFTRVIFSAEDFYDNFYHTYHGLVHHGVTDEVEIVEKRRVKPKLDYRDFKREQLLKAGEEGYIERNDEVKRFRSFIRKHYRITNEEIDDEIDDILHDIKSGVDLIDIFEGLSKTYEFPDIEAAQAFADNLLNLYNCSRQWVLKGHMPKELLNESGGYTKEILIVRSLNSLGVEVTAELKDVAPPARRVKIGRNEPCPCGSGKKYKKCCGK